jgi:RNA polymerase sigma-70 factor (ECF subfamily)
MSSLAAAFERGLRSGLRSGFGGPALPRRSASPQNAVRAGAVGALSATVRALPLSAPNEDFENHLKPLWLLAQAGDEAAYRVALQRIAQRLRSYLRRRMQSLPDDLEDLVQETLLALHLQRGTYDPALPVSAWVLAIARHKLVDLWRRRGRQEALHDPIDDVDEGLLMQSPVDVGAARDLGILLAELSSAQRDAIVLTKIEGLSVAEASARTGASESAIKVQVHRGLKKLAALVQGA